MQIQLESIIHSFQGGREKKEKKKRKKEKGMQRVLDVTSYCPFKMPHISPCLFPFPTSVQTWNVGRARSVSGRPEAAPRGNETVFPNHTAKEPRITTRNKPSAAWEGDSQLRLHVAHIALPTLLLPRALHLSQMAVQVLLVSSGFSLPHPSPGQCAWDRLLPQGWDQGTS